uniref:Predicted nuclease, contains PIN domain, potential toxin-antitoxin system component n=1 Tax=Candidatus Kentrum sp. DK TaxID=2126562 RepID=A0A450TN36_9GAMM|nr:MAG: Predicted nuclease, contains PIN domain, potential toxin-antitoxin system component [Candidatus Kentron sp. DK]
MSIRFLLDENMPFALLEFLAREGYEAEHLKKIEKVGIKNGEVYKVAEQRGAWIVTRDSDFKNYHKFVAHGMEGVIVFSLTDTTTGNMLNVMRRFLKIHVGKLTSKHLIIIDDSTVKIHD